MTNANAVDHVSATMPTLYFWPLACSLASRIALMEAGIAARYRLLNIWTKEVPDDGSDIRSLAPKGAVPILVLADGQVLTESAAVLQWIADQRPAAGLAPPAGEIDRYRLAEWLSFVGTEIHKGFLFPTFWYADDASKAAARQRIGQALDFVAAHLADREHLVGERFTVADGYLAWSLLLTRPAGVDLAPWPALVHYAQRIWERPQVKAAIAVEQELRKTVSR